MAAGCGAERAPSGGFAPSPMLSTANYVVGRAVGELGDVLVAIRSDDEDVVLAIAARGHKLEKLFIGGLEPIYEKRLDA